MLGWEMMRAVNSVIVCNPDKDCESRQQPGRFWIGMEARSKHSTGSGLPLESPYDPSRIQVSRYFFRENNGRVFNQE